MAVFLLFESPCQAIDIIKYIAHTMDKKAMAQYGIKVGREKIFKKNLNCY